MPQFDQVQGSDDRRESEAKLHSFDAVVLLPDEQSTVALHTVSDRYKLLVDTYAQHHGIHHRSTPSSNGRRMQQRTLLDITSTNCSRHHIRLSPSVEQRVRRSRLEFAYWYRR